MQKKFERERIKTVLSSISTKTEIAMQALRKYEQQKAYHYHFKNRQGMKERQKIYNQMNNTYTSLYYGKYLKPHKSIKIQIFPHDQEYYVIDASDLLFPVRLFFRNVRNNGILYIGYDLPFPGLNVSKFSIKDKFLPPTKIAKNEPRKYSFKFIIKQDIMVLLNKEILEHVGKIYISLISNEQIFMFDLKFDHIGYPGMNDFKQIKKMDKNDNLRKASIVKLQKVDQKRTKFSLPPTHRKMQHFEKQMHPSKRGQQSLNRIQKISRTQPSDYISSQKYVKYEHSQQIKNFITQNRGIIKRLKKTDQQKNLEKQKSIQKQDKIRCNRKHLEEQKQKMLNLKILAAQFKKQINQYKKFYDLQKIKYRKSTVYITRVISLIKFLHQTHVIYERKQKYLSSAFMIRFLIKKFANNLKAQQKANKNRIHSFKCRNKMPIFHFLQLNSKSINNHIHTKCLQAIDTGIRQLTPGIILNQAFNQSQIYRKKIKKIQRYWLIKYENRLKMLKDYTNRQVKIMTIEKEFYSNNHCHKICYEYLKDESIKFRLIYDAYRKRMEQIRQFIKQNQKIKEQNKNKPKRKWKQELQIPTFPSLPQQRFFRNLDILKSMLRGWFELQYKRILKKNTI